MQRDNTIDALKFFLIFFVVLGHSIPKFGGGIRVFGKLHISVPHASIRYGFRVFIKKATDWKVSENRIGFDCDLVDI